MLPLRSSTRITLRLAALVEASAGGSLCIIVFPRTPLLRAYPASFSSLGLPLDLTRSAKANQGARFASAVQRTSTTWAALLLPPSPVKSNENGYRLHNACRAKAAAASAASYASP
ncbi:unnamed protein product [Rangifer tarandus platyrhynchus]|uniref:Secreted protein n=1 Tax=Rangifer tarandus platyrhynchus TaxID=3082113 RepID=A0ABN8XJ68_RANTA|nr:unnamed protein product [Rangifer tarandus platyrhynchus]